MYNKRIENLFKHQVQKVCVNILELFESYSSLSMTGVIYPPPPLPLPVQVVQIPLPVGGLTLLINNHNSEMGYII